MAMQNTENNSQKPPTPEKPFLNQNIKKQLRKKTLLIDVTGSTHKPSFKDEFYENKARELLSKLIIAKTLSLSVKDMEKENSSKNAVNEIFNFLEEYETWYCNILLSLSNKKNLNKNADRFEIEAISDPLNENLAQLSCITGALGKRIGNTGFAKKTIKPSMILHESIYEIIAEIIKQQYTCDDKNVLKNLNNKNPIDKTCLIVGEALLLLQNFFEPTKTITLSEQEPSMKQEISPAYKAQQGARTPESHAGLQDQV